jgi:hypothetical protein
MIYRCSIDVLLSSKCTSIVDDEVKNFVKRSRKRKRKKVTMKVRDRHFKDFHVKSLIIIIVNGRCSCRCCSRLSTEVKTYSYRVSMHVVAIHLFLVYVVILTRLTLTTIESMMNNRSIRSIVPITNMKTNTIVFVVESRCCACR